ncbi:hypothetical protein LPJ81_004304 [Coemansia sp. IMI 209127]|nr:hypothetical protein LPJ81_004304 [Coemansia sp. IMI 209127]
MDLDAKLREFPHFSQFVAIRQRSSQSQHALQNEGSEGKQTPSEDDRRASATAPSDPLPKWTHLEPPGAVAGPAAYSPHHTYNPAPDHATLAVEPPPYVQATFTAAPAPRGYDERRSSLASILIADRHSDHESRNYRSPGATYAAATHSDTLPRLQAHHTPSHLTEAVSSMTVNSIPAIATSRGSSESQDRTGATSITDIPSLLRQADSSAGCYSAFDGDDYGLDIHTAAFSQSIDGIIERMRALAGTSTSADISTAAQQIMNYVERESRRRHIQSERHLHVVSALAEVMSRSSADTTAAPSASTSRRSSGPAHEHRRYHPAALNQKPEDSALHMIHEVPAPASRNIEQQIVADTAGPGNGAATHDSNIPHRRAETHSPPANSNTIKLAAASPMNPAKTDSPL